MTQSTIVMDGTEKTVVQSAQVGDAGLEVELDLNAMQAGDTVELRVYSATDGVNFRLVDDVVTLSGVQAVPVKLATAAVWCSAAKPVKVTLKQTAGTNRTFAYATRVRF